MNRFGTLIKVLAVLLGIVAIGYVVGMLGTLGTTVTITSPPTARTSGVGTQQTLAVQSRVVPRTTTGASAVPESRGSESNSVGFAIPQSSQTGMITNWEDRLDEVLGADKPENQKGRELMAIFYRLPADGQLEVAQHMANLVPDEEYASLAQFTTNSTLPEDVLDVLVSDLLNRPNSVKVPTLVDVASDPKNPKSGEAKDILELFLEEDYGTDWKMWRAKAEAWVKDNPD